MLRESLRQITNDAAEYNEILNVLLLGRYKRTQPKNMAELAMEFPDLRLSYMTVHRSKGLESDYVVVLDLCSGKYGFPSEIPDDPLLELVLAARERHPNPSLPFENILFYQFNQLYFLKRR